MDATLAALDAERLPASFRDPSGFVFRRDGVLLRHVGHAYRDEFDHLLRSGLYDELTAAGLIIPHSEQPPDLAIAPDAYKILRPEVVPFVSYPYEWSFSQLQDAALLTLEVQRRALEHGMTLRDASAYNVQFRGARPVLIDTLSFGMYTDGMPWSAYRQFCQHFLAPLLLMSRVDVRLGRLLQLHLDGIPIDLTSRLLPRRSWLRPGTLFHVHAHARSLARHADTHLRQARKPPRMGLTALKGLAASLESNVRALRWEPTGTEWADYAERNSYAAEARSAKERLVREYLDCTEPRPGEVWDLGANTGSFSRIAAETGARVVSFDIDPAAVERNYLEQRTQASTQVLPLLLDLTNPSPAIGWANREREAWSQRGAPDVVLALALVHHLAIANNLPLARIAELFAQLAPALIIEFVPKGDSQVQRLLGSREDIFTDYDQAGFEAAFEDRFAIVRADPLARSDRRLYLMERRR